MLSVATSVMRYQISQDVTVYDIAFPFWDFSEIVATVTDTASGASVTLERNVDYTITVSEPITDRVYQDGTLTMTSDKFRSYNALVIQRIVPTTQETHFENSEPIDGDVLEASLDRIVGQIQQLDEGLGHTIRLPYTDSPESVVIPEAAQRKNMLIGFGNDGIEVKMYPNTQAAMEAVAEAKNLLLKIVEINKNVEENLEESQGIRNEINGKYHPGYRVTIGDGETTEFFIKHDLHSEWVQAFCWYKDVSKAGYYVFDEVDMDTLKVTFRTAPEANSVEVRIIPSQRVDILELADDMQVKASNLQDVSLTTEEIAQIIEKAASAASAETP